MFLSAIIGFIVGFFAGIVTCYYALNKPGLPKRPFSNNPHDRVIDVEVR